MNRCTFGLHKWQSIGWKTERKSYAPCERETVYRKGRSGWEVPIPMERCYLCHKERVKACYVVTSAERAFLPMPMFDCICGKGNEQHRQEWKESKQRMIDLLRHYRGSR